MSKKAGFLPWREAHRDSTMAGGSMEGSTHPPQALPLPHSHPDPARSEGLSLTSCQGDKGVIVAVLGPPWSPFPHWKGRGGHGCP